MGALVEGLFRDSKGQRERCPVLLRSAKSAPFFTKVLSELLPLLGLVVHQAGKKNPGESLSASP